MVLDDLTPKQEASVFFKKSFKIAYQIIMYGYGHVS